MLDTEYFKERLRDAKRRIEDLGYYRLSTYAGGGSGYVDRWFHHYVSSPTGKVLILLEYVDPASGYEIFVPVATSNKIEDTFLALEKYTREES